MIIIMSIFFIFHIVYDDDDEENVNLIECRLACKLYITTQGISIVYSNSCQK